MTCLIILAFDLCHKLLELKLKKHYSINDIKKLSVPQSLKREILDEIYDLLNFRIFYIFHIIFSVIEAKNMILITNQTFKHHKMVKTLKQFISNSQQIV